MCLFWGLNCVRSQRGAAMGVRGAMRRGLDLMMEKPAHSLSPGYPSSICLGAREDEVPARAPGLEPHSLTVEPWNPHFNKFPGNGCFIRSHPQRTARSPF